MYGLNLGVHIGGGIVLNAPNSYGFAIGFNCMNTTPFTPPPYALLAQNQPNKFGTFYASKHFIQFWSKSGDMIFLDAEDTQPE